MTKFLAIMRTHLRGSAPGILKKYGAKIHDNISDQSVTGSEWLDYISDCSDLRVKQGGVKSFLTHQLSSSH